MGEALGEGDGLGDGLGETEGEGDVVGVGDTLCAKAIDESASTPTIIPAPPLPRTEKYLLFIQKN